eukprot:jgi/Botrbrau1/17886/Bobra.0498s0004.2
MLQTGHTYERQYIQRWLEGGHTTCPITQETLTPPIQLTPNVALRHAIEDWAEKNAIWLLGPNGKVKPIPDEEQFAQPRRVGTVPPIPNCLVGPRPDDLALAIQLQEQELMHATGQQERRNRFSDHERLPHLGRPGRPHFPAVQFPLYILSGLNIGLYVYALSKNNWDVADLQENPLVGPPASVWDDVGALSTSSLVQNGQYWRLLTSIFLCPGAIALFCVLSMLWTLGTMTERFLRLPILTLPFIYVGSGVAGALWSANLSVNHSSCGATASICGLLGAVWADHLVNWKRYQMHIATVSILLLTTSLFAFLGILPLLDNFFHLGSLIVGALMCCVLVIPPWARPRARPNGNRYRRACWGLWQTVCVALLAAFVVMPVLGLVLANGQYGVACSWCDAATCVSTQWWTCSSKPAISGQPICSFTDMGNSSARIDCPGGVSHLARGGIPSDNSGLIALCRSICQGAPAAAVESPDFQGPPPHNPNLGALI